MVLGLQILGTGGRILKIYQWLFAPILILFLNFDLSAFGSEVWVAAVVSEHWGYLQDVSGERELRFVEMEMIERPPSDERVSFNNLIFVPELEKEFQGKYEKQFGYTVSEQSINVSRNSFLQQDFSGIDESPELQNARERAYGEYVVRRLLEYHADRYAKASPSIRPVYEAKERLSNVKFEVKRGYRLKIHYSLSGNYLDLDFENPLDVETKCIFQMDENSFGPGVIDEATLKIRYTLTRSVAVGSYYGFRAGQFSLAGYKALENGISTSITGSTFFEDSSKENKLIIGLSWNY
jgi:hypothetical protein